LKSSFIFFHNLSTALLYGNIFVGKLRNPPFLNFNSMRNLPQFKASFVSTKFAVCSVLIVNSYTCKKASLHITLIFGPSKCTTAFLFKDIFMSAVRVSEKRISNFLENIN
jgi:hypothetical protein